MERLTGSRWFPPRVRISGTSGLPIQAIGEGSDTERVSEPQGLGTWETHGRGARRDKDADDHKRGKELARKFVQ
jgi:hypothetical protein